MENIIRRHMNRTLDIESVAFSVTYRCNSRCMMCNIWKNDNAKEEIDVEKIRRFFSDSLLKKLNHIVISGGEPFLRNDLPEIIDVIGHKDVSPIILSNGLLPNIPEVAAKIGKKIKFSISIDGIEEMHDKVRGIKGAYSKATITAKELIRMGYEVSLGFTATGINDSHILKVRDYANSIGAGFAFQIAHITSGYFGNCDKIFTHDIGKLEATIRILREGKTPQEKLYYDSCISHLKSEDKDMLCYSGYNSFHLDPYGNIFRCIVGSQPFGNIKDDTFERIWKSKKAWDIRKSSCNCTLGCEFGNTSRYNPRLLKYKVLRR